MAKVMPHNIEAEQAVLGSVFLKPDLIVELVDKVKIVDLFDTRHINIYKAFLMLFEKGSMIDYTTVINELNDQGILKNAGNMEYVVGLADAVPSAANFSSYVNIVKELALKRKLINTAAMIAEKGFDPDLETASFIDYAEEQIYDVAKERQSSKLLSIDDVAKDVLRITENNILNAGRMTGLHTGFENLNRLTWGLQKQDLIILAARPGMGKSAIAMNLAVNIAKYNKTTKIRSDRRSGAVCAIFSLEMSAEQLVSRMISSEAAIDNYKIKKGRLDGNDMKVFSSTVHALGNLNIYFEDSSAVTVGDIRAKCRKLSQERGLDFVVIDYLQLISGESRNGNRQEEVAKISRSLKQMARELNVPVLALSQLSRSVETRDDKKPIMSDLRESGSIEQDADMIMFLYREAYYQRNEANTESLGKTDLIIAKNRHGTSGVELKMMFTPEFSRFNSIAEE